MPSLKSESLEQDTTLNNIVPSLNNAISSAVVESLKSIRILPVQDSSNSDAAAAVQGSVAAVVHDLTGDGHISSTITPESEERVSGPPDVDNRPDKVHRLTSVSLASRVTEKQAQIWANEYIDLGILLASFPSDSKYNFTVKSVVIVSDSSLSRLLNG